MAKMQQTFHHEAKITPLTSLAEKLSKSHFCRKTMGPNSLQSRIIRIRMFLTGKNVDQMIEIMNGELNKVFLWLNSNKLSLNVKKTQFMVFSLRKHIITNTDLCINNQIIDRVEHTMFLGVILEFRCTSNMVISYSAC